MDCTVRGVLPGGAGSQNGDVALASFYRHPFPVPSKPNVRGWAAS